MKRNHLMKAALISVGLLTGLAAHAQLQPATNRLSFSARFGMSISGKLSGASPVAVPTTYMDGNVAPDISGSADGYTWNWGYNDSTRQVNSADSTILMTRSAGSATLSSPSMDDGTMGGELVYTRELRTTEKFRYGLEGALNFMSVGMSSSSPYSLRGPTVTDALPFFPGTTPPGATPGNPYQGTFEGPGFVIGTTPVSSTPGQGTVGTVTGSRTLDATIWGGRVGPYLEYYVATNLSVSLSGGLAFGLVNTSVDWDERITFIAGGFFDDKGSGSDTKLLVGGYLAANVYWRLDEHWGAVGSVQYQSLGTYEQAFGTRKAELDLGGSVFFSIGVNYGF